MWQTPCILLGLQYWYVHTRNDRDAVMVNFKPDAYMKKMFFSQWHRRLGRKIPSTYLSLVNYTWHREPNQPIRSRNISVMRRPVLVLLLAGRESHASFQPIKRRRNARLKLTGTLSTLVEPWSLSSRALALCWGQSFVAIWKYDLLSLMVSSDM